jgi:beta-N-acetylhexosaminidase
MIKLFLSIVLCFNFTLYAKNPPLEDMIAQMIVIGFDGAKEGDKWVEQVAKDIKRGKVGGVVLDDKNIQSPSQLKKLTEYFKFQSPLVLIVAEQEGGENSPFSAKKGFQEFPSSHDMAKSKDIEEGALIYKNMSEELAKSGINVNFAPVLDLTPKSNFESAKFKRSFSSFEEITTTYATLFIHALNRVNVAPVLKYFPTAGANLWDGFSAEVDVTKNWRFEQLKPYYDLIAFEKPDAVLMSHVLQQELDNKNPALFSSSIIQKLLRDKMHFEGVVFANNFRAGSISSHVDFKQRVIRAVNAGVDILVFSNYFADSASTPFTVQKILLDGIKNGEIKQEQIVLSYGRIVKFKQKLSKKRVNHVN